MYKFQSQSANDIGTGGLIGSIGSGITDIRILVSDCSYLIIQPSYCNLKDNMLTRKTHREQISEVERRAAIIIQSTFRKYLNVMETFLKIRSKDM